MSNKKTANKEKKNRKTSTRRNAPAARESPERLPLLNEVTGDSAWNELIFCIGGAAIRPSVKISKLRARVTAQIACERLGEVTLDIRHFGGWGCGNTVARLYKGHEGKVGDDAAAIFRPLEMASPSECREERTTQESCP